MKIKVIDLLNKIANNKWIPIKIKYDDCIYEYENNEYGYVREENKIHYMFLNEIGNSFLNDEVEIIEDTPEEKKIPEKLEDFNLTTYSRDDEDLGLELNYTGVSNTFNDVYFKINEIIDYLDYLKSKGDE